MTEQQTRPGAISVVERRRLGIGLCTGVVAIAFESISVATAMPRAAADLDGLAVYAWNFTLFVVGMLLATVVAGRVADRRGPLRPLVVGMTVFAAGLVLAGSAEVMGQLLAGRLVQGIGAGAINLGLFVVVARVWEEARRPVMMTWVSTAWIVPAFVGPPVSAWITETFSWHWVFYGVLPLVLVAGLLALPSLLRLQRSGALVVDGSSSPVPLWAGGLAALAAAGVQLAGQRSAGGVDLLAVLLLVVSLGLLLVSLPRLMPAGFLRLRRGISAVVWTRAVAAGSFFGAEAFVPLMLVQTRDVPLVLAGASLTVGAVGWTTGAWLQSRSWLTWGRERFIQVGTASLLAGLVVTVTVAAVPEIWVGLMGPAWLLVGLGMGLLMSSTSVAMMTLSPASRVGRNFSSLQVGEALGNALLAGLAGTVHAAWLTSHGPGTGFGTVFTVMSVTAGVGLLLALRIGRVRAPVG